MEPYTLHTYKELFETKKSGVGGGGGVKGWDSGVSGSR